jgi:para-nitrobenzyl esterase
MKTRLDRREWMKNSIAVAGGVAATSLTFEQPTPASSPANAILTASSSKPVVETSGGKVRGYTRNGIHTFKGIPYAATTAGGARFLPPSKLKPWTGVRSSMQYGPVAPQPPRDWSNDEVAFLFNWNDGIPGEDCLRLNIWSPGITDNRKRPVMVWLHGGGYVAGNGQEHPGYDGENLSHRGDGVVISLNHRLGVLGYLDLSEYGERYASSGNVGNLDIVAALEWVRGNIAGFGGDPGNVTIFGQSGGGSKVSTLMAMPSAVGLLHRGIVQSGSSLRQATPDSSRKLAAAVVEELGLRSSNIGQIHELPYDRIVQAGIAALRKLRPVTPSPPTPAGAFNWGPVVDGKILPNHAWDPTAPSYSARVPLLVGTTLNEFTTALGNPANESLTDEEVKKRISPQFGQKTDQIIEVFRRAHPQAKPLDIYSFISTARVRQNAVTQAERKAAQDGAPAYLYQFAWQTPVLDGRPRAFHCSEIAFAFCNTDLAASMTGGTSEARVLAERVSDAWINFARKGDPNHSGLPKWPAFSVEKSPTMIFDNKCEVRNNHDGEERKAVAG